MKNVIMIFLLVSGSIAMADGPKRCTKEQLMTAIQEQCGKSIKFGSGKIGHYQGEVSDTYIVPVKKGSEEKNLVVLLNDGGLDCKAADLDVKTCP